MGQRLSRNRTSNTSSVNSRAKNDEDSSTNSQRGRNINLQEIITRFKDLKATPIDSSHLLFRSDIFDDMRYHHGKKCRLHDCKSVHRIGNILRRYHQYIEQKQTTEHKEVDQSKNMEIHQVYPSKRYSNRDLLNDFNHLLFVHSDSIQFEDIHNILIAQSNTNKQCEIGNCLLLRRNHRNRSTENNKIYFDDNDQRSIVMQQHIDKIHSYYLHSFDFGHRISRKDRERIIVDVDNDDDAKYIETDDLFDPNFKSISNFMQSKQELRSQIPELNAFHNNGSKFTLDDNPYSYGFRYYYWEYYRHRTEGGGNLLRDPANAMAQAGFWTEHANVDPNDDMRPYSNLAFFVEMKYSDPKEELLQNEIYVISLSTFDILATKAIDHAKSSKVREIYCARKETAECYEMKYREQMHMMHLIAIMVYCNEDELQRQFTATFRKQNEESEEDMIERHRNYYYLGRLLRECVECFGMKWDVDSNPNHEIHLYHGVNTNFSFESLCASIKGPLSTTTDFAVAVNFCGNQGLILDLSMKVKLFVFELHKKSKDFRNRLSCFDCHWISDYPGEREIFFIGGLNAFHFNNIIEAQKSRNYCKYIKGIRQISYCMANGGAMSADRDNIPDIEDIEAQQMVFRLLSHELYRYNPQHSNAHEFKSCPDYIKDILHSHCERIKYIGFLNRENKECLVHEGLFKYDNGWLNLDLLLTIFPNVQMICYNAKKENIAFLKQEVIYDSVLELLRNDKEKKLEKIQIFINLLYFEEMEMFTNEYYPMFKEIKRGSFRWSICAVEERNDADIAINSWPWVDGEKQASVVMECTSSEMGDWLDMC